MRGYLRVLSIVFAAAVWSVPQTVRAQDERKALLDSLFFPEDFEIGFFISSDIFRPKPAVQDVRQLEQALKIDQEENPHLHCLYAGALAREHKGNEALSEYAIAARGYGALAERQALSGEQAVEWAEAVEQTGSINDAIQAAEQCLGHQPADSILIHRYLVDGYSKAAMATMLGVADVQAYDASSALGALLAMTETGLRGNALEAQDCLQKARLHAEAAVADRAVAPIDFYNMSFSQVLAAAMDRMKASLDRPGTDLPQSELLAMFLRLFKSPSMTRAFDMGRDDPRVQGVRPLWELTNEIDFTLILSQSFEDWPTAAQQALKRRLQDVQEVIRRQGNPSAEAYESLATMLFSEDEWDEALEAARRALTLDPTQRNSFNIALLVLSDDGKWKDVEQWARKRALVDHSASSCGWVAIALAHQGKAEQVDEILDEAVVPSAQESDWIRLIRGTAQLKRGDTTAAIVTLETALRHDETNAVAAYNLAVAYYLHGIKSQASEYLGIVADHPQKARYADELTTQAALLLAKIIQGQ